jgi:AraC-like DNA-binding protein/quercetin dioxygenase-like cupin family protein
MGMIDPAPNPVVVHANHFQFAPGQVLNNPSAGSRMLLWCRSGRGSITVDGQPQALPPGKWVLLPWRHRVSYSAERRSPFQVGGVHLVPDHDATVPVTFAVPNHAEHPLWNLTARRDAPWSLPTAGHFAEQPLLQQLAEVTVGHFQAGTPNEADARALGRLIWSHLGRRPSPLGTLPRDIARVVERLRIDPAADLSVDAMAAIAGCSRATLVRRFQRHLQASPQAWVKRERLNEAARLLASTSLPIGIIAVQVGMDDLPHFTRSFSQQFACTPLVYRRKQSW